MRDAEDIVSALGAIEERLRELAYDRLRAAAEDENADAVDDERRLQQARRAVERAMRALGGSPED